jgi:hypothetical protein
MKNFTNKKTHLDDFFAEARTQNVAPAGELLKAAPPQNPFKNTFAKAGFAGIALVAVTSFFVFKSGDEVATKPENLLKTEMQIAQNNVLKTEIPQEKPVEKLPFKNTEKPDFKAFKKNAEKQEIAKTEETKIEFKELQQSPQSIELSAIPLVELQDFELQKLGIEVLKDGDLQMTQAPNDDTVHFVSRLTQKVLTPEDEARMHKLAVAPYRFVSWEEHARIAPPTFVPKRITDLSGTTTYFVSSDETERKMAQSEIPPDLLDFFQYGSQRTLDSALKIKLQEWSLKNARLQDSLEKTQKYIPIKAGNFIAWFRTSEEVLERLPYFVANTIRAELLGKDLMIQTEEFREEYPTSGFCYLDMCEKASGAIICSKISPNPAQDKRTVLSYELAEERNIITALYDLSGRKLREFSSLRPQQKGKHEEEISLAGIEKGIYLVAIITDRGEKLSRRIIID